MYKFSLGNKKFIYWSKLAIQLNPIQIKQQLLVLILNIIYILSFICFWQPIQLNNNISFLTVLLLLLLLTNTTLYIWLILSNPGILQQNYHYSDLQNIQIQQLISPDNNQSICFICKIPKLNNQHHCRSCNLCVSGFQQHSFLFNNCIGHNNIYLYTSFVILQIIIHVIICVSTFIITGVDLSLITDFQMICLVLYFLFSFIFVIYFMIFMVLQIYLKINDITFKDYFENIFENDGYVKDLEVIENTNPGKNVFQENWKEQFEILKRSGIQQQPVSLDYFQEMEMAMNMKRKQTIENMYDSSIYSQHHLLTTSRQFV